MGSGRNGGPIQTVFNNFRPWAKTIEFTKFHQNISKCEACRFKRKEQDGQMDGQA